MNRQSLAHLAPNEHQAIGAFLDRLYEQFPGEIHEVMLFGSKARGDSHSWSDIDILIIVAEESWPLRSRISNLASDVSLEYDVLIGPRVVGRERWQRMKRHRFGLYQNVAAEGVPLTF